MLDPGHLPACHVHIRTLIIVAHQRANLADGCDEDSIIRALLSSASFKHKNPK